MEGSKDQQQWLQRRLAVGLNWTLHLWLMLLMRDGVELWKAQVRTFLGSKIGCKSAGFQGTDLAATNTILACAKHFAG
jgi:beta-glucosidase